MRFNIGRSSVQYHFNRSKMSSLRTYSDVKRAEQALIDLICEKQEWDRNYTLRRNRREHQTFCSVFLWMEEKKQGIYLKFKIVLTTQCLARVSEAEKEKRNQLFFPSYHWLSQNWKHFEWQRTFPSCAMLQTAVVFIVLQRVEYGQESAKRAYTPTLIYHANKTGHQVRRVLVQLRRRIWWTSFNRQCQIKSPNSAGCY